MRLLDYSTPSAGRRVGLVVGDEVVDLTASLDFQPTSLHDLLQLPGWLDAANAAAANPPAAPLDAITFEPMLGDTGRVFAAGLNYEKKYPVGTEQPKKPTFPPWFGKAPGTLVAHGQPVVAPIVSESFDYEAELAAVIGTGGRHIPADEALDHVAGWTCLNDGSVRHWQRHSVNAGKNFERSGSIGPWMVTADEIADPQALRIFSVAQIIEYLSQIIELRPGDVIATGSPEGTGGSYDPPRFLEAGQMLEIEVEGIGILRNNVIAEADA